MMTGKNILHSLSQERLETFRCAPDDGIEELLDCYFWNIRLTEALYPSLANLEVILRNRIAHGIKMHYGDDWLDSSKKLFTNWDQQRIADAIKGLSLKPGKKAVTTGRIIAELPFGFWTNLLSKDYEQILWPQLTKVIFAFAPKH